MLDLYDSNEKSNVVLLSFHITWEGQIGNSCNLAFDKFYVAKKEFVELFLKTSEMFGFDELTVT